MDKIKFIQEYISNLKTVLDSMDLESISSLIKLIETYHNTNKRIYLLGNGGSASTASHMANDLGVGLKRRDIVNIDIISLSDNISVITALANDVGYEDIFYYQLKGVLKPEDLIIAISCSGNSPNIIKATNFAKDVGSKVITFTGFDGGKLKPLSDLNVHVQTENGEYGLVEDVHMILDHIIYTYFIHKDKING